MTNLQAMQNMTADEFSVLIDDMTNYDNPNWEWKSKLLPALPFESWRDWLEREAKYDSDKR